MSRKLPCKLSTEKSLFALSLFIYGQGKEGFKLTVSSILQKMF